MHITNPPGSGHDLVVSHAAPGTPPRKVAVVRPGETYVATIRPALVEQRARPARLQQQPDGSWVPDTRPGGPPNSGRKKPT